MNNTSVHNYLIQQLLAPCIVLNIFSVVGLFGNTCIILATIAKKSLRNTCSLLIAIASFMDVIVEISIPPYFYFLFRDQFITVNACWYVQFLPSFGIHASFVMALMIGFDRLLSIKAPLFLVLCTSAEFLRGSAKDVRYYVHIGIAVILVFLYAYLWYLVKTTQKVSNTTRKIIKSLTVITIITAATWPTSQIALTMAKILCPPEMYLQVAGYCAALSHVGFAANFFVYLFFRGQDHIVGLKGLKVKSGVPHEYAGNKLFDESDDQPRPEHHHQHHRKQEE